MRVRFTTRRMLLLVTCWSIALFVWRAYIYEPPTHKIPLYEKALSTRRLSARIGPNTIRIKQIDRNRRDGSLVVEDGHSTPLPAAKVTNPQAMIQAAPWLDVVQIELQPGPELLDILEVRIFEHQTRTLLSEVHPNFGWQVLKPNLLQLYGLGKELPEKVDVWLRLQSYDATDSVVRLQPNIGANCRLPGDTTLTLKDFRAGSWAFDSRKEPSYHMQLAEGGVVSTEILWQGNEQKRDYQIAAVSRSGTKAHSSSRHFLRFGFMDGMGEPISFRMSYDEIAHFELRPFGGRHRFFFEAVQLPPSSGKPFAQPPVVIFPVEGKETTVEIPEFAPLSARFSTYRGNWANGATSFNNRISITPRPGGAISVEEVFTLTYQMRGLGKIPWQLRFQDKATKQIISESELQKRGGGRSKSTGLTLQSGYSYYQTPLEQIEAIEVKLQPVP